VSGQYLSFLSVYALALVAASLVVLTERGQTLLLYAVERLGSGLGVGPWGLLDTFGYDGPKGEIGIAERASLAESYIASAEGQMFLGARVVLWVLIAGFVACAVAAIVIIGVLPPLVEGGMWSYDTYENAAMLVVYSTAVGGLAMGAGLVTWLLRRTLLLNRTDGCAIVRDLLMASRADHLSPDARVALASGSYPRLERMLRRAAV
jgi:hypothetical protein